VKGAAGVIAAGSAFAVAAVGGLLIGIALDHARHTEYFAVSGLFAGIALGGYAAFRLLVQTNIS
jgi:acid phosphatase family membrane protein YuiD